MCPSENMQCVQVKTLTSDLAVEYGLRSSPYILQMIITGVDRIRYHDNIFHIIFITMFLECLDFISVTIEHLLDALVVSIPLV